MHKDDKIFLYIRLDNSNNRCVVCSSDIKDLASSDSLAGTSSDYNLSSTDSVVHYVIEYHLLLNQVFQLIIHAALSFPNLMECRSQ